MKESGKIFDGKPIFDKPMEKNPPGLDAEIRENFIYLKGALTRDPEIKEPEPKIQRAKHVGIFTSLVKIGDEVKEGHKIGSIDTKGIIEEVEAEIDGTIADVLPDQGAGYVVRWKKKESPGKDGGQIISTVEYGQPLFAITPTAKK